MSESWHGDAARCGGNLLFVGGMLLAQIELRAARHSACTLATRISLLSPSR